MSNSRKHLKISSILVLVLAAATFIKTVMSVIFGGLPSAIVPEGSSDNIVLITQIGLLIFSAVLLLPQIYVGVKGILVSKHPTRSKLHIIVAIVLFIFSIIGLVFPIIGIINREAIFDNIGTIIGLLLEILVYFDYIKYAKMASKSR
jgi:hypothetical protein